MTTGKKPMFQANPDKALIVELLKKAHASARTVSYDEISAVIERDVRRACRHILESSRKALEKEGMLFACISNEGLKPLYDIDKPDLAIASTEMVRRSARRQIRRCNIEDITKIPTEKRIKHIIAMGQLALVDMAMTKKSAGKIGNLGYERQHPTAALLEALKD